MKSLPTPCLPTLVDTRLKSPETVFTRPGRAVEEAMLEKKMTVTGNSTTEGFPLGLRYKRSKRDFC